MKNKSLHPPCWYNNLHTRIIIARP